MKRVFEVFLCLLLVLISNNVSAFNCKAEGKVIGQFGGSRDVIVSVSPEVQLGQNLVIDLSSLISCQNTIPKKRTDYLRIGKASAFAGALEFFEGSLMYDGLSYPIPVTTDTTDVEYTTKTWTPVPAVLYLTPISAPASGVVIEAGQKFAKLKMKQHGENLVFPCLFCGGTGMTEYTWNLIARNRVVVPTGGCDVSSRDVVIDLGEYTGSNRKDIPLTVHCATDTKLKFFLSGKVETIDNSIFSNVAGVNPAKGFGIQIFDKSNNIIQANKPINLGSVGETPIDLGLSTDFVKFGTVNTPGEVTAIVNVTFQYM